MPPSLADLPVRQQEVGLEVSGSHGLLFIIGVPSMPYRQLSLHRSGGPRAEPMPSLTGRAHKAAVGLLLPAPPAR